MKDIDQIPEKWKEFAFLQFVSSWDEDEADAVTAFDNLMECTEQELEFTADALDIEFIKMCEECRQNIWLIREYMFVMAFEAYKIERAKNDLS